MLTSLGTSTTNCKLISSFVILTVFHNNIVLEQVSCSTVIQSVDGSGSAVISEFNNNNMMTQHSVSSLVVCVSHCSNSISSC